jgi:hypothetical protein
MLTVNDVNTVSVPRYMNDPDYFLVAELNDSCIISNRGYEVVFLAGTEVFVECDELASQSYYLTVILCKNHYFTTRVPRSMVSPIGGR